MLASFSLSLWMWVAYLLTSSPHLVLGLPAKATPTSSDNAAPNTTLAQPLLEIPGARIDRSSLTVGGCGVLVHYISDDVAFETATKAIVVIQGARRNASDAYLGVKGGVQAAGVENVVLLAPVFFNEKDKGAFPWENGEATSNQLVWKGDGWLEGANNLYPTDIAGSVSSFDGIDAAIAFFADKDKFPLIEEIILAGHSAGGQVIQRYVILADDPPKGARLRSVIANPGTYAYFSPDRLIKPRDNCTTYNDWRYGLENYTLTYQADLFSTHTSRVEMRIRYLTRPVHYLLGTADLHADDQSCDAKAQGAGHLERGILFWKYITESYPGPWIDTIQKLDFVPGVPHDKFLMWKSKEGQAALFPE